VDIGTPISFDTLDKWEAWVAIGTILLALATLILGFAAFVSARETRRQRRNLTRPELIDLPSDPEGPEEVVTFGRRYDEQVAVETRSTSFWTGDLGGEDSGRWGCTFRLRNSGLGSAKIISASLAGLQNKRTIQGEAKRQFVPPRDTVRLIFEGDESTRDLLSAAQNEAGGFRATVRYSDFEGVDMWETIFEYFPPGRGLGWRDVRIAWVPRWRRWFKLEGGEARGSPSPSRRRLPFLR
jgi:hypothetical protein